MDVLKALHERITFFNAIRETVFSHDNAFSICLNGNFQVCSMDVAEGVSAEAIRQELPAMLNEGLARVGEKMKIYMMMHVPQSDWAADSLRNAA